MLERTHRWLQLILPNVNTATRTNTKYLKRCNLVSRAANFPRYVSTIRLDPEAEDVASTLRTSVVRKVSWVNPLRGFKLPNFQVVRIALQQPVSLALYFVVWATRIILGTSGKSQLQCAPLHSEITSPKLHHGRDLLLASVSVTDLIVGRTSLVSSQDVSIVWRNGPEICGPATRIYGIDKLWSCTVNLSNNAGECRYLDIREGVLSIVDSVKPNELIRTREGD